MATCPLMTPAEALTAAREMCHYCEMLEVSAELCPYELSGEHQRTATLLLKHVRAAVEPFEHEIAKLKQSLLDTSHGMLAARKARGPANADS